MLSLAFGFKEIDAKLPPALIDSEAIQAHHCELGLVCGVKSDHSPASWTVSLDDCVHSRVILGELLEHKSAEIDGQVFNLDRVGWLDFSSACRRPCRSWLDSWLGLLGNLLLLFGLGHLLLHQLSLRLQASLLVLNRGNSLLCLLDRSC